MRKKGLFTIVDGPSASGKDSIIQQVLKDLSKLGIKAISIHEGREKIFDQEKILSARVFGDQEIAQIIVTERKKLYDRKIAPRLMSGTLVIANRGEPSTLAYQTLKNELTMEDAWNIHRSKGMPIPNFIIITNCSVREAIRRENQRGLSKEEKGKKFMSGKFTKANSNENKFEKRKRIHSNYKKVKDFFEKKGISLIYLDTDIMNVAQESKRIVKFIKTYE